MKGRVLVIGKAKSGTTIISKTIQYSLKIETYYLEIRNPLFFVRKKNFNHDYVCKILFEHWNNRINFLTAVCADEMPVKFSKIICIIRDPRDVLISYLIFTSANQLVSMSSSHLEKWINLIKLKEKDPCKYSFVYLLKQFNKITGGSVRFQQLLKDFIIYDSFLERAKRINQKKIFILRYEDFIDNKIDNLSDFLGVDLVKYRDPGKYVNTPRTKKYDNWKEFLTKADLKIIEKKIGSILTKWGYVCSQNVVNEKFSQLNSEFYSSYILDVIKRKRENIGDINS